MHDSTGVCFPLGLLLAVFFLNLYMQLVIEGLTQLHDSTATKSNISLCFCSKTEKVMLLKCSYMTSGHRYSKQLPITKILEIGILGPKLCRFHPAKSLQEYRLQINKQYYVYVCLKLWYNSIHFWSKLSMFVFFGTSSEFTHSDSQWVFQEHFTFNSP